MASGPGSTRPTKEDFLSLLDWNPRLITAHLADMHPYTLKRMLARVQRLETQIAEAEFHARQD